jgi:sterol desaturase/sphingolipid hydroxylase (fatty acid hydroxylase superfamily)
MTIIKITVTILFFWMAIIVILERVRPYRKGLTFFREGFWVDLVWYTLIQGYILKIIIFDYIIQPVNNSFNWSEYQFVRHWSIACQVVFFTITHDFYIYWFHRLQHANKFLWRTHEAHHSGKEVDFLQGSRSHIIEIIINQTIEFLPIIVLGAAPEVLPIKLLIDGISGMFIHANIDVKLGKWKYIFNSPELHLWHHSNYEEVFHANFSTKFSFWDYIFGTVYFPNHKPGNKSSNWGLYYDFPKDYFLQHFFSFKRFNELKLLRFKWFEKYYHLRPRVLKTIISIFYKKNSEV